MVRASATRWLSPPEHWRGSLAKQRRDVHGLGRRRTRLLDLGLRLLLDAQAEGDVLVHRHVREQREILEHHAEPALAGLEVVDHGVADDDLADGRRLQPGDHVERRRLAAAGRADHDQELAVRISRLMPLTAV